MKFNQGAGNEISRWFLFILLFVVFGGGFAVTAAWIIWEGHVVMGLLVLGYALLWCYMMAIGFHSMAAVTLSEKGVALRVYMRGKFYSWDEIQQTGVLWSTRKYGHYNDLILLPNTGSPRMYQDKTFARRNRFKLIHIPYTPDSLEYLRLHYGPLDFDLSDGKTEAGNRNC